MTPQPTLTSRDIGLTENALRALLLRSLTGTGLDYNRWVALKTACDAPTPLTDSELAGLLVDGLKVDAAMAATTIDDLKFTGLFEQAGTTNGPVVVTPEGAALYRRLMDHVGQIGRQIYADLEVEDLAVAYRVLSTVHQRANLLLAS
jgi:hypothetical protein